MTVKIMVYRFGLLEDVFYEEATDTPTFAKEYAQGQELNYDSEENCWDFRGSDGETHFILHAVEDK